VKHEQESEGRQKLILAFLVLAGLIIHSRSFDIFFYNDDLMLLQQLVKTSSFHTWLFERVVDHIILVPKLFYGLFFRLFGLNAVPWHFLILFVHGLNIVLLYSILNKAAISFPARAFATGCFATTTVFHECIYWVGASTFLLCLPFCLGAVLAARYAEERQSYVFLLFVSILVASALFSVTTGLVAVVLVPLSLLSMPPGRWSKKRALALTFLFALLGCVPYFVIAYGIHGAMAQTGPSVFSQFDSVRAAIFTGRSVVEYLVARYFTGGSLPFIGSLILFFVVLSTAALAPADKEEKRLQRLAGPLCWILFPTFLILSFRSWMGDVVFVSRYQILPAAGFTWVLALSADGVLNQLRKVMGKRIFSGMLLIAFGIVFAMQTYASYVCHNRWLERTERLKFAHQEIASNLRSLLHEWKMPLTLEDHLIAGGQGWRPTLRGITQYVLTADEQKKIHFTEPDETLKYGLDARLVPLVNELRAGRPNWLTWFDDLSVSFETGAPEAGTDDENTMIFDPKLLFAERQGAQFNLDSPQTIRLTPLGIGYTTEMTSLLREDIVRWKTLRLNLRSEHSGEALISFPTPADPAPDHGARVRLPAGESVKLSVDVPLALRGPAIGPGVVKITFTDVMTPYEVGAISISCTEPCN
jgi:hypothetical protein